MVTNLATLHQLLSKTWLVLHFTNKIRRDKAAAKLMRRPRLSPKTRAGPWGISRRSAARMSATSKSELAIPERDRACVLGNAAA